MDKNAKGISAILSVFKNQKLFQERLVDVLKLCTGDNGEIFIDSERAKIIVSEIKEYTKTTQLVINGIEEGINQK